MKGKPQNEFFNKNIVITGASSGIGRSAAIYFLNCGANVVLAGQDKETMVSMCKEYGFKNATVMTFDLINDQGIYDFKTAIVETLNKIDILVTCHGILFDGDIEKTFPQDFDYSLDIKLRSIYLLIKYLCPFINENSSIINISCLYGTRPCTGLISQGISKAGLESLTRYLAGELSLYKIRVNAITTCPVDSNALRRINISEEEISLLKKKMEYNIPMGRMAYPDDIVKVISFLASNKSKCITGQIIRCDGGRGLTSSGYVHYKGLKNMNSRFEPNGLTFGSWIDEFKKKLFGPTIYFPIGDFPQVIKFVGDKINESNFSTNLSDAHLNVNAGYKFVETNVLEISIFSSLKKSDIAIRFLRSSLIKASSPRFKFSSLSIRLKYARILFLACCVYAKLIHSLDGNELLFVLILIISLSCNL